MFIVGDDTADGGGTAEGNRAGQKGNSHVQAGGMKTVIMAFIILLGVGGRLFAVGNILIMERDLVNPRCLGLVTAGTERVDPGSIQVPTLASLSSEPSACH